MMSAPKPRAVRPTIVAVEMGYGHLRPAHALAELIGGEVLKADEPPLAGANEQRTWARTRFHYETLTRLSQLPLIGGALSPLLGVLTSIPPLYPARDLSNPTWPVHLVERMASSGIGRGLVEHLRRTGTPLLTTFFVPALIADRAADLPESASICCVVTDSDINRVWAPMHPRTTRIQYFAPSTRVVRRLIAYGVPKERITLTGFPLPHELLGGPALPIAKANLLRRLARLDGDGIFRRHFGDEVERTVGPLPAADGPPRVAFAVGGAGAQAELADRFLPSLAPVLRAGRLQLTLIAGVRREVADRFRRAIDHAGLGSLVGNGVEILHAPDLPAYFRAFNHALADVDALWTKPSELAFFAALGLGIVFSPAVGEHEWRNARWAMEHGAALRQHQPEGAAHWLADWLADGTLAQAAWSGFRSLPKQGLYEIAATFSSTS
ncbi:MAG TPA: hypothetical protein VGL86_08350 [Polyangia bacterium]